MLQSEELIGGWRRGGGGGVGVLCILQRSVRDRSGGGRVKQNKQATLATGTEPLLDAGKLQVCLYSRCHLRLSMEIFLLPLAS